MINAYAQNLDIQSRERVAQRLVRRDLASSDWRPGFWKEDQNNGLAAQF
jgi:arginine utilization protein RocB